MRVSTMKTRRNNRSMTPDEARECIAILCAQFEIDPPVITWNPKRNANAHYQSKPVQRIIIGQSWRGVEPALLHEFAHHLNHARGGDNHDSGFWQALREVATTWYGDEAKYPWGSEYETGRKIAAGLGIRRSR